MRISKKNKLLFVHIPRCAGKSIIVALKEKYPDTKRIRGVWEHARLKEVHSIIRLKDYMKVAVVRNPWERMVSLYCFLSQQKAYFDDRKGKVRDSKKLKRIGFSDWLIDFGKKSHNIRVSDTAQTSWISSHGKIIADEVIRFENLTEGCRQILGLDNLPIYHKTDHTEYVKYYNKASKMYVNRVFSNDIHTFNYKFGD